MRLPYQKISLKLQISHKIPDSLKYQNKIYQKMKISRIILLLYICLFSQHKSLYAQTKEANTEIIALKIGETIPDELWKLPLKVVNDPTRKKEVTLEQYKGKLILLDFWGTYCSACIAGFPKMNKIQEDNSDKLKILAISFEQKERIDKFFNSAVGKEYSYINSTYGDTELDKYFPHQTIPHIVWISPEGKYVVPTNDYEVTQENIDAVYRNQHSAMLTKVDLAQKMPLLLSDNFYLNNNLNLGFYSLFFQGYYPGYPTGSNFKRTKDRKKVFGRQMTNMKLNAIVCAVASQLFEQNKEQFTMKRIILNSSNPYLNDTKLNFDDKLLPNDQYYSYELIVPEEKADSLYTYMLADLNRYLDVRLSLRKQMTNCLVLVRTSKQDKLKSKGNSSGRNFSEEQGHLTMKDEPLVNLISLLNEIPLSKLPIIDETGYTNNIDVNLSDVYDLEELRKSLAQYDLDLQEAKRDLLMFVVTDKK